MNAKDLATPPATSAAANAPRVTASATPAEAPDTLTAILLGLRLDGVEYGRCVMREPWAIAFHPKSEASFHFIAQGACWMRTDTSEWMQLNPGDAVLLPRGTFHVLASSPDVPCVDIKAMARKPVSENLFLVNAAADDKENAEPPSQVLFCGSMRFNLDPLHPLLAMMPDVMRACDLSQRDPAVLALLDAREREIAMNRIGACGILARLADVLAASIIRGWVECACADATGWLAAVRCPQIGRVLAAVHNQPDREWSVAELAAVMGASRSRFIEKFSAAVGETPARYVARVKMFQARQWLSREGLRIAVVANRLGYDSEASFSRAFKRIIGHPPSEARAA